ncbi:hypothetical protein WJX73_007856 [Symbiochloris irregularis]|uniref:Nodulin-like domain-containing protein n=1 Tax=Symbiochloris irregularis TaxID=706552 RepID=A0AAW1PZ52_9CHLO
MANEYDTTPFFFSKWMTYSAACLVMLSAGLAYTFSVWSDAIKHEFGYSQTQLAGIGTAGNIGGYLAVFAGLFYDALRGWNRAGPFLTVLVGIVLQTGGNLGLWFAAKGMWSPPYYAMLALAAVACNGQTWFEAPALVTCVRNFETERGTVIGILKALLGLSASAYTTIYVAFLEPDAVSFLLLLAIGPSVVALLCVPFINFVPFIQVEPHTKSHAFHLTITAVVGMALYQGVTALARNEVKIEFWGGVLIVSAVAILILPILAVPFIFGGIRAKPLARDRINFRAKAWQAENRQPLLPQDSPPAKQQTEDMDSRLADVYRVKSPVQLLRSQSFWLLLIIHGICAGSGLTLLNNLAEQVKALGADSGASQAVFVSVFSIANCFGRLCSGSIPDKAMRERDLPRTVFLIVLACLSMAAALLNAFATLPLLGVASTLSGLAFGGMQGIAPAITSEIFGMTHFATNYSLLQLGPAIGSTVLATYLAGTLYTRAGHAHGETECTGQDCFRLTFIVCAALGLVAILAAVLLWRRTQPLYDRVISVTKEERRRRGLQGELEEGRQILQRVEQHNTSLNTLVMRGRDLVGHLHQSAASVAPPGSSPGEAKGGSGDLVGEVGALEGLMEEVNVLLTDHREMWRQYQGLPMNQRHSRDDHFD